MTKVELMSLVGHKVRVKLFDDDVYEGELLYFDKLETIYGNRMPGYFCIDNMNFKVSHVKEWILISWLEKILQYSNFVKVKKR